MYVAPLMRMGAWSMACVLRRRIDYYYYHVCIHVHCNSIAKEIVKNLLSSIQYIINKPKPVIMSIMIGL